MGTLDEFETPMRLLAERAGIFTYAVEYHLSPEVKWPTALDEGEFVVRWLIEHAAERGVDSNKASPAFLYFSSRFLMAQVAVRMAYDLAPASDNRS